MPPKKILARGWVFELSDGQVTPTWTAIGGLNTWGRSHDATDADTTDFDSDGWREHIKASRGNSLNVDGHYMLDPETGARDPGQELVEELADLIDFESIRPFRYYHVASGKGRQGEVSCTLNDQGGGNDDTTSWGATFQFSGALQDYDNAV